MAYSLLEYGSEIIHLIYCPAKDKNIKRIIFCKGGLSVDCNDIEKLAFVIVKVLGTSDKSDVDLVKCIHENSQLYDSVKRQMVKNTKNSIIMKSPL